MRVFWTFVLLLVLAGGAFMVVSARKERAKAQAAALQQIAAASAARELAGVADRAAEPAPELVAKPTVVAEAALSVPASSPAQGSAQSPAAPPVSASEAASKQLPDVVNVPASPVQPSPASPPVPAAPLEDAKPKAAEAAAGVPPAPQLEKPTQPQANRPAVTGSLSASSAEGEFVGPPSPSQSPSSAAAGEPSVQSAPVAVGADAASVTKIGAYEVAPGKVETKADGALLLDGRFTVRGDGSKDKPYEISWELLTSVEQDFDPHAGKRKIPQRIAMLHDKYVKLSGWIAFPLSVQQPRELLLMLNQWDGCCIGVPPTPYDAIEVALTKVVNGESRFTTTGGVTGKFGVKPYVVGDWLVGLYTMEQGDLAPKNFNGGGS